MNFNLNKSEFVFTFESQGTSFIFEDMITHHYMSGDHFKIRRGESTQEWVPKSYIEEMNRIGESRTVETTKQAAQELRELIKQVIVETSTYQDKNELTLDDVKHMFQNMAAIMKLYEYFDMSYWDTSYKISETNSMYAENIKLIGELKNVLREELNPIYFSEGNYLSTLLEKLSQQFGVSVETLSFYTEEEIKNLFSSKRVSEEKLNERKQPYVYGRIGSKEPVLYTTEDARKIIVIFADDEQVRVESFKGIVAHGKGRIVQGKVKLITRDYKSVESTRQSMASMEEGDILVAQTTDPDLLEAMKKAGAIVTDVGGLLSHGAITSRELDKVCIIGTVNASKVLKDGDLVEVDATNGVVKVIK